MLDQEVRRWTATDAAELYDVGPLGQGLFLRRRIGTRAGPSDQGAQPLHRSEATGRRTATAGHRSADPDPLRRHPEASAGRNSRRLSSRHQRTQIHRPLLLRVSDQGQPAAAGGRRSGALRQAVSVRTRSRQQARAAGRHRDDRQRHADHLQRLQGRRVHRDGDAGPQDRPQDHSGGRKIYRARTDPQVRRKNRRAADVRHSHQAGRPRLGALAVVGRISLQVRADGQRNFAGAGRT